MTTPDVFPIFTKAGGAGGGDLILLSEGLSVEVDEMPDVTIESEINVEVEAEISVELDTEIEVEVTC